MARRKRQAFPTDDNPVERPYENDRQGGLFGFFRDHGVRETVESIIVAVILALMFRAYEAEAFVIPTGSMAPTLQGQHMDVECQMCKHNYRTGNAFDNSTIAEQKRDIVSSTFCPICQFEMKMRPQKDISHQSFSGDRILVNKFIYDFTEPKRFDVIVFKNPNNGKQNFIKRLVGLPGDNLLIDNGDLFDLQPDGSKQIIRKPHNKVQPMLQLVDDTNHVAEKLQEVDWPSRWAQRETDEPDDWAETYSAGKSEFYIDAVEQEQWLRYCHIIPTPADWEQIRNGERPTNRRYRGQLISDYYCYNHMTYRKYAPHISPGFHWVGDLALDCEVEIKSSSGVFAVDLVEAGAHFTGRIDVATGNVEIICQHASVNFENEEGEVFEKVTGVSGLKGPGTYRIVYANVDDQLFLWVNNKLVELDAPMFSRNDVLRPKYPEPNPLVGSGKKRDAGDAEPAGIGTFNVAANVNRLKVLRDVYYTAATSGMDIENERQGKNTGRVNFNDVLKVFRDPQSWATPEATHIFVGWKSAKPQVVLELSEDQFLPMGDNSPRSSDGRVWDGPKNLPRELLIGRAMVVYWPHMIPTSFKVPLPNFERMGFIR